MVLPYKPTLTFTIPSLYDDVPLDCRVYIPSMNDAQLRQTQHKSRRGAIIAHPYAPLGGCYDDHVVGSVGGELLKNGWTVGTFNFRGAGSSKGRTSWTGRPELEDYISFVGFMVSFLSSLDTECNESAYLATSRGAQRPIRLILGGYSYGSLIVSHLPAIDNITARFDAPVHGTAAAEIYLRAKHLSAEIVARSPMVSPAGSPTKKHKSYGSNLSLSMGGDEIMGSERRKSRESSRLSLDSLHGKIRELSHRRKGHGENGSHSEGEATARPQTVVSQVAYLLISPLMAPVSTGLALGLRASPKDGSASLMELNPTLIAGGSEDLFTSAKRLVGWLDKLQKASHGLLTSHIVEGAGHFWTEDGVMHVLTESLSHWSSALDHNHQ